MEVVFSKFAEVGLTKEFGDGERRDAWRAAIKLHLINPEILDKSTRLPEPRDKQVYVFPMSDGIRVTFEWNPERISVWSITHIKGPKPPPKEGATKRDDSKSGAD